MKLENLVAVITGSGSGIGRAIALAFAHEGAKIVVADINEKAAIETVMLIKTNKGTAIACQTDVAKEVAVNNLVAATLQAFGQIDVLVNDAAIQVNKTVADTSFEEWNAQMAVNVGGVFLCSKLFLPYLKISNGNIVNMSSVNGYFVEPSCAGYCATKAAIIGLTKAMAIDHGHEGIRVNCICPGYIDSGTAIGYFESQPDPIQARADAGKLHALWRIGKPEEVAQVAIFLASSAASFVTGSAYVVDGGFGSGLPPK